MQFKNGRITQVPMVDGKADGTVVAAFFTDYPHAPVCAVCRDGDKPVGVITRTAFQTRMASPLGRAMFGWKPAISFVEPNFPPVAADDSILDVLERYKDREALVRDGFVVVDEAGRYLGVIAGLDVFRALYQLNEGLVQALTDEVKERERAEREVRKLAESDPLTGLLNRRTFAERLADRMDTRQRFVCVYIDLDRFKPLNDNFGHAVGDDVLRTISVRLSELAHVDLVARLGGDEFACVIDVTRAAPELERTMRTLHDAITDTITTQAGRVSVGASVGYAVFPADGRSTDSLLHAADLAMIEAKSTGGGVRAYDRTVQTFDVQSRFIEQNLALAVATSKIQPALQPIIDLQSLDVIGHEALARWVDSEQADAPTPARFIPIAERIGVLDKLFWSLAEQTLDQHAMASGFVALNVSPSQLTSVAFLDRLGSLVRNFDVAGGVLELEVTEQVLFQNIEQSRQILHAVKDLGVRVSLDDFGTGHSSLLRMSRLPFDKIKIDRCFLSGQASHGSSILEAVIRLCDTMGVTSCAEGVETAGALDAVRDMSCSQAQGYLIGRPKLLEPGPEADLVADQAQGAA
ncbi:MAG: EAL domain-containing protein [Pseudomonadota bacterium]